MVQPCPMRMLLLLMHENVCKKSSCLPVSAVCKACNGISRLASHLSSHGLLISGDPCQTIARGISFRFADICPHTRGSAKRNEMPLRNGLAGVATAEEAIWIAHDPAHEHHLLRHNNMPSPLLGKNEIYRCRYDATSWDISVASCSEIQDWVQQVDGVPEVNEQFRLSEVLDLIVMLCIGNPTYPLSFNLQKIWCNWFFVTPYLL